MSETIDLREWHIEPDTVPSDTHTSFFFRSGEKFQTNTDITFSRVSLREAYLTVAQDFIGEIEFDYAHLHGVPRLTGKRLPLWSILYTLSSRKRIRAVSKYYGIQSEQVVAAIQFAAEVLRVLPEVAQSPQTTFPALGEKVIISLPRETAKERIRWHRISG